MTEDITPALIESVNEAFREYYTADPMIMELSEKGKAATYNDAYKYAERVGTARVKAFEDQVSAEVLPDGKMYYNIASRLADETLIPDQEMVVEYSALVQNNVNKKAKINLKAQKADINQDNVDSIVNKLCASESYEDVSWILGEAVKTLYLGEVDATIEKNAEFQSDAGLQPIITREAEAKCCPWCLDMAGQYTYPDIPSGVFGRHDNCRCTLDYGVKRLSAYMKGGRAHSFRDPDKVNERKRLSESITSRIRHK